jgi:predicted transcriptional regulator
MPNASDLTDLHLQLLTELWAHGEATVADLHLALAPRTGIARKTIATLLGRLEQRGFVRHRTRDRENVYRAAVPRRKVLVDRVAGVLGALFPQPLEPRAAAAVSRSEVQEGDVDRLLALLRRAGRDVRRLETKPDA